MMAKTMKRMFALILAVSMVMSLSVNAFAADDFKVICGKDEHLHDEDCYEQIMQCGKEAGDPHMMMHATLPMITPAAVAASCKSAAWKNIFTAMTALLWKWKTSLMTC